MRAYSVKEGKRGQHYWISLVSVATSTKKKKTDLDILFHQDPAAEHNPTSKLVL